MEVLEKELPYNYLQSVFENNILSHVDMILLDDETGYDLKRWCIMPTNSKG